MLLHSNLTAFIVKILSFRHLLGDIQCGFNTLLESSGDDNLVDLVPNNPYSKVVYTKREAECVCVFCLCVLGEIGNTKNNLIGVSLHTNMPCVLVCSFKFVSCKFVLFG